MLMNNSFICCTELQRRLCDICEDLMFIPPAESRSHHLYSASKRYWNSCHHKFNARHTYSNVSYVPPTTTGPYCLRPFNGGLSPAIGGDNGRTTIIRRHTATINSGLLEFCFWFTDSLNILNKKTSRP